MDIPTQAEVALRRAGYETSAWSSVDPQVVCFESATVLGFVHSYPSVEALRNDWLKDQQSVLTRYSEGLRNARQKAWNVYSVFLTEHSAPELQHSLDAIEEDFSLTRKLARASIRHPSDVDRALSPLFRVRAHPLLGESKFEVRLRSKLKDVSQTALDAFLADVPAEDVAHILRDQS